MAQLSRLRATDTVHSILLKFWRTSWGGLYRDLS